MQHARRRHGLTIVETVIALAALGVLASLVLAVPRPHVLSTKDATYIKGNHQAMIIRARSNEDRYPTPGLIDRRPVDLGGTQRNIPGRGEEDTSKNTTAALFSALIVQNYFTPEICISPVERNAFVERDEDFSYDAYSPADDRWWDPDFTADLEKGSNTSYAHLLMAGERKERLWRNTMLAGVAVVGNRGPKDGTPDPDSHTCGPHGTWYGNMAFADNYVAFLDTTRPERSLWAGGPNGGQVPDDIFAVEGGMDGPDVVITFTKSNGEDGPVIQFD